MKFIDLYDPIMDHFEKTGADAKDILTWLDEHPELTGKAVTADRYRQVRKMDGGYIRGYADALRETGTIVLPDPKPTNEERIKALLEMAQKDNAAQSYTRFAEYLDKAGVKAPGVDDE